MYILIKDLAQAKEAADAILLDLLCGLDTETYGVEWDDAMFSLQIATAKDVWYFNFQPYDGELWDNAVIPVLPKPEIMAILAPVLSDPRMVWFIHNAKFDLRRLAIDGLAVKGGVHCTQMQERFVYNQHMHYSLDACLKRRGMVKDDAVDEYIKEHRLWTDIMVDGEKVRRKHYDKVPFALMFPYACSDAERCRLLGLDQRAQLEKHAFYHNDLELEKVAYKMEEIGIACDTEYALKGWNYELQQQRSTSNRLADLANEPFRSGPLWLRRIFDSNGVPYSTNPKTGNPIFDKAALDAIEHPIAGLVRQYRRHEKYASTYYSYYAKHPLVHANIKLFGTDTGRFSYAEPNLQNVPKEEEPDFDRDPILWEAWNSLLYPVRGCFRPRSPDHVFVMVDFDQQEFRLLLDYAGEHELIRRINENGEDVHQATADMVGCTRKQAKTLNFGLLYGMGAAKLAKQLGCSLEQAKAIKAQYFAKLPKVARFIKRVIEKSERHGQIHTWCDRVLHTPRPTWVEENGTKQRITWDYKMPNHLIQGGCGDIARFAMVECAKALEPFPESNILIQVHDELLFEFHKNDLHMVEVVRKIMENTYKPWNGMKLTCGVEHSWKSWSKKDVVNGPPTLQENLHTV